MTYRYQLKLKSSRECVDLREYKGEITSAVRIGLGNKNVKVVVRKEYYQFCYEKEKSYSWCFSENRKRDYKAMSTIIFIRLFVYSKG